MSRDATRRQILEAERNVLRVMCQGTPEGSVRAEAARLLARYTFLDAEHQVVFDALREFALDLPRLVREQLPARLTQMGFPDLNMDTYFEPHGLTAAQALALMRELATRPGGGPSAEAAR